MKNKSFEEILEMLEKTAETLEKGEAGLEDSIRIYQDGINLYNKCKKRLEEAEQKINIINTENFEENDIEANIIAE